MSNTQKLNFITFIPLFVMLINNYANQTGITVSEEEITNLLLTTSALIGVVMNFWHRYSKGDITLTGKRK